MKIKVKPNGEPIPIQDRCKNCDKFEKCDKCHTITISNHSIMK